MFVIGWKFGDGTCILFDEPMEIGAADDAKEEPVVANDTQQNTMVGDTFDIDGQVFEVVEALANDKYRLNDGRYDVELACAELEERPRVAVLSTYLPFLFSTKTRNPSTETGRVSYEGVIFAGPK